MKRSDEPSKSSAGRATISTSEEWNSAAKRLFGERAELIHPTRTRSEPTVTCPQCLLEFLLIFDDEQKTGTETYEVACPRCARPFRFIRVKQRAARNAKKRKRRD